MRKHSGIDAFVDRYRQDIINVLSHRLGFLSSEVDNSELLNIARLACRIAGGFRGTVNTENPDHVCRFFSLLARGLELLDNVGDEIDNAELFLQRNKNLIYTIAQEVKGRFIKMEEALSIAYEAYHIIATRKRNQFKKAKLTSVFYFWYVKKLYSVKCFDGGEREFLTPDRADTSKSYDDGDQPPVRKKRGSIRYAECDFDDIDFEQHSPDPDRNEMQQETAARTVSYSSIYSSSSGLTTFQVCLTSFRQAGISKPVINALQMLTSSAVPECTLNTSKIRMTPRITKAAQILQCKRPSAIRRRVLSRLNREMADSGVSLFRGECLNGCSTTIIVCATDADDARRYLESYGRVLKVQPLGEISDRVYSNSSKGSRTPSHNTEQADKYLCPAV